MAAPPRIRYNVSVKCSGGTNTHTDYMRVTNTRTKEYKIKKVESNEVIVNAGELSSDGTDVATTTKSGFNNGDIIEVNVSGYRSGSALHTIDTSKGGIRIALTLADNSTTTSPLISF